MKYLLSVLAAMMLIALPESDAENRASGKLEKMACKEAKKMAKEGWHVLAGCSSLEKQIEDMYRIQYESCKDVCDDVVIITETAKAQDYDQARKVAMEVAKLRLIGMFESKVSAYADVMVSSEDGTASAVDVVEHSRTESQQILGPVKPVLECYRILPDKMIECVINIIYNIDSQISYL